MKWWKTVIAMSVMCATSTIPVAMAASTTATTTSTVLLNNDTMSAPQTVTQDGVTYIPVWYIMQVLKTVGFTSTWNGQTWSLTTANPISMLQSDTTSQAALNATTIQVTLNGQPLCAISALVAVDPASKRATTYVNGNDLSTLLNQLNLVSSWQNGTFTVETPTVAALAKAFMDTSAVTNSQLQGELSEQITLNLTDKGKADFAGKQTSMDLGLMLTDKTGIVNGEKAIYITLAPSSSSANSASTSGSSTMTTANTSTTMATKAPQLIQEYIQGSRVYVNSGQGWTEEINAEQLIQSLQAQIPMQDVNFTALRNIQATSSEGATIYTANLDGSSLAQILQPILSSLTASTGTASGVSSSEISAVIRSILKQLHASMQVTVQPVAAQNLITSEQMTLDMNLPVSALPIPASSSTSLSSDVTSITLHETVSANYTYNNTPINPPSGLPTTVSTGQ